jgi:hypothetical protein
MAICLRNLAGHSTQNVRAVFRAEIKWVAPEAVGGVLRANLAL